MSTVQAAKTSSLKILGQTSILLQQLSLHRSHLLCYVSASFPPSHLATFSFSFWDVRFSVHECLGDRFTGRGVIHPHEPHPCCVGLRSCCGEGESCAPWFLTGWPLGHLPRLHFVAVFDQFSQPAMLTLHVRLSLNLGEGRPTNRVQ